MDLVIDAGNTFVKIGFFNKEKLERVENVSSDTLNGIYALLEGLSFEKCILGSVINIPAHLVNYLRSKSSFFLIFDTNTLLPIKNLYSKEAGTDRIAMMAAARHLYPERNCLAIGLGTCITLNFISEKGVFSGGSISPGLAMRFKALNRFTASLPMIELGEQEIILKGNTTESSILSVVVNGMIYELKGFISSYKQKYSNLYCIICGGDSRYIGEKMGDDQEVIPELVLYGLHSILKFNAEKKN